MRGKLGIFLKFMVKVRKKGSSMKEKGISERMRYQRKEENAVWNQEKGLA